MRVCRKKGLRTSNVELWLSAATCEAASRINSRLGLELWGREKAHKNSKQKIS